MGDEREKRDATETGRRDRDDELTLDKETLKDLELGESRERHVKGGQPMLTRFESCSCREQAC